MGQHRLGYVGIRGRQRLGDGRHPVVDLSSGGVYAFRRILSSVEQAQVVVSIGRLPARIDQWIGLRLLRDGIELRDRQAERFQSRIVLATTHFPPRNTLERSMVEIWEETLEARPVGVIDNFFTALRGNSLLATQLISWLCVDLEIDISHRSFLDGPTIAELPQVAGAERADGPAGQAKSIDDVVA